MCRKLTEWQGDSGRWYCADISDLGKGSAEWWRLPRTLGIPLEDFVKMVHASGANIKMSKDKTFLSYHWKSQSAMRKFKNTMNKLLREVG